MAQSSKYKVYDRAGSCQASCKEPEAAVAVAAIYGTSATVRLGHGPVIFTQGKDGDAHDSIDLASMKLQENERAAALAYYQRQNA